MQVLNEVLPGFPSPVQLPGGRPALTGMALTLAVTAEEYEPKSMK